MEDASEVTAAGGQPSAQTQSKAAKAAKKEIPPGVSYVNTPGLLKRVLDKIISAQQPEKMTPTYLGTVWQFTGGSAAALPPFLKKTGFLQSDGAPTELYSKFRTDSGRSYAVRQALHKGFPELFKQNENADFADEKTLTDIVVQVTGRERNDQVVKAIVATFRLLTSYINQHERAEVDTPSSPVAAGTTEPESRPTVTQLGLNYQINLILPETSNIDVLNAIFRSLRDNLLR